MGVLTRFKDIMASNFNSLLDKAEDPEKMVDQYLRNLESDMAKVKAETASVMAEEKSCKRKLDEVNEEMNRMTEYAKKAIAAGNDGEAKQFLEKKSELAGKKASLQESYDVAKANADKMREMSDKLEKDISEMRSKRDTLKAKAKVADAQERINKLGSSVEEAGSNLSAFERMEEKVNRRLDEVNAMAELNEDSDSDSIEELAKKYDSNESKSDVDDELAALKAELGM